MNMQYEELVLIKNSACDHNNFTYFALVHIGSAHLCLALGSGTDRFRIGQACLMLDLKYWFRQLQISLFALILCWLNNASWFIQITNISNVGKVCQCQVQICSIGLLAISLWSTCALYICPKWLVSHNVKLQIGQVYVILLVQYQVQMAGVLMFNLKWLCCIVRSR